MLLIAFALVLSLVGTVGCSRKSPEEMKAELEKLKKKEKPKPDFELPKILAEPSEKATIEVDDKESLASMHMIKPGHWTGLLLETKANNFDFSGTLQLESLDNQANRVSLEGSPFFLSTSRQASLPKGQKKTLEAVFFAPQVAGKASTTISDRWQSSRHGEYIPSPDILSHMPSYQYFMVVLSRDPNRYRFLKVLNSAHIDGWEIQPLVPDDAMYYRHVFVRPAPTVALPAHSLCWTSIACVVWDDVLPTQLTAEQQLAMIDWLHWGGNVIISGPDTLNTLRGSFLEPYLPAYAESNITLAHDELAELNRHWTLTDWANRRETLEPAKPLVGVKLALQPQAEFLPGTGQLAAERRVGRGRVVVTAFRLHEQDLLRWRSFDSFFNACLLRRASRSWSANGRPESIRIENPSRLRILTRDIERLSTSKQYESVNTVDAAVATVAPGSLQMPAGPYVDVLDTHKGESGIGGWNDFNAIAAAARHTLREAAGISVPKREFVVWMVGIYLLIIVPANWLFFRLLGRVEWAWIAVPVVSLTWGMIVIWLAQLDIGFARAETEVGVLELQNDFPRAHLTRYTALYTSLSTSYDVHFDDPAAIAQPFSVDVKLLQGQAFSTIRLHSEPDRHLDDFPVRSNSTGMVHSEQMIYLGGTLRWQANKGEPPTLENGTPWKLSGVAILRRAADAGDESVLECAWLGDLVPGSKVEIAFEPFDADELAERREQSPWSREARTEAGLSLGRLIRIAQDPTSLSVGDVRLVAWRDEGLPGVRIVPASPQARRATLVVANLEFGAPPAPRPDANLPPERRPFEEADPVPEIDSPESPAS